MGDMTIETRVLCETSLEFEMEVTGSRGDVYVARFGEVFGKDVQRMWSCTCSVFKFSGGKPCKHIAAAKAERCAWNEDFGDGGTYTRCPECHGPVEVIRIAV
jgi:hypothetical protein